MKLPIRFVRPIAVALIALLAVASAAFAAGGRVPVLSDLTAPLASSEPTGVPEASETPEATEAPKASETPEATEAPKASETPEASSEDSQGQDEQGDMDEDGQAVQSAKPEEHHSSPMPEASASFGEHDGSDNIGH